MCIKRGVLVCIVVCVGVYQERCIKRGVLVCIKRGVLVCMCQGVRLPVAGGVSVPKHDAEVGGGGRQTGVICHL